MKLVGFTMRRKPEFKGDPGRKYVLESDYMTSADATALVYVLNGEGVVLDAEETADMAASVLGLMKVIDKLTSDDTVPLSYRNDLILFTSRVWSVGRKFLLRADEAEAKRLNRLYNISAETIRKARKRVS